ncbi:MAG: hypothetical protein ACO3S0_12355, partial [bacterium]
HQAARIFRYKAFLIHHSLMMWTPEEPPWDMYSFTAMVLFRGRVNFRRLCPPRPTKQNTCVEQGQERRL